MTGSLMLVDAAGLWFRSYYALPESLTAPDGTPVNAVRGFCDMLAKLLVQRRPSRLVVCLDNDWRPQFRVDALPSYKTHRVAEEPAAGGTAQSGGAAEGVAEQVPDTLGPQVPVILEVLDALGLTTAEAEGYEADDVLGALAGAERTDPVEVITGDRDLFQLVSDGQPPVRVLYIGAGLAKLQDCGPAELAERYALPVERAGQAYADMAVLRGDPSDGLPGVAGIGEKTAAKLITEFGSLDALLEAAADGDRRLTARNRAKLDAAADYLRAAPAVVRVVREAPVVHDRDNDRIADSTVDRERLAELRNRWGLGTTVDRLLAALEEPGGE